MRAALGDTARDRLPRLSRGPTRVGVEDPRFAGGGYSSPESGFGLSLSVATVYGTTLRSAPCSAHSGIGFDRSLPMTPSNVLPSSGPYRWPSTLSSERFSKMATTTWSMALLRSAAMRVPP